ncbi:MAG: hypothetical protein J6C86_02120 [Bacteroidaceae bacterium]|nr:hypothetical protein [Bacteroidaceae bacterium]
MRKNSISIGKFEQGCINEDAVMAHENIIAVSDGAGGGGLFAERWSHYLLEHLPSEPIKDADELDAWIEQIWEPFYNRCEEDAKLLGGLSLDKFYDEGSFATLAVVWKLSDKEYRWMRYGDSVAFHYNYSTHKLEHSFGQLADFDNPPFLINCKDELNKEGFKSGVFKTDNHSVVFVASDALAHYILMMYKIANKELFAEELKTAESHHSKNENYIKVAMSMPTINFEKDVLGKLINGICHSLNFHRHLKSLIRKGLLAHDDYSFAIITKSN